MAQAKATLFFTDGNTLDVTQTLADIEALMVAGVNTRSCVKVTRTSGVQVWVNLGYVCRIEPA